MQEKEFYKFFPIKMKSNKNILLGQYNNLSKMIIIGKNMCISIKLKIIL